MDVGSSNYIGGMITIASGNVQLNQLKEAGSNVNSVAQYKNQGKTDDKNAALQQFEGLFLGQLLRLMFETVPVDKTFGGGMAEETYKGMVADEYGVNISKAGGIGIAKSLQKSLFDFGNINHEARQTVATADAAAKSYTRLYNFK